MRAAASYMQGVKFSRGGQLPFDLFDSMAMSEQEAHAIQLQVNTQRLIDETLREARRI